MLGRNPRLQRPWIFLVRVQWGMRRPRVRQPSGCNLSESGPSGQRPSGRAGEAEEARNPRSSHVLRSGTGVHGGLERCLRGLPDVQVTCFPFERSSLLQRAPSAGCRQWPLQGRHTYSHRRCTKAVQASENLTNCNLVFVFAGVLRDGPLGGKRLEQRQADCVNLVDNLPWCRRRQHVQHSSQRVFVSPLWNVPGPCLFTAYGKVAGPPTLGILKHFLTESAHGLSWPS